LRSQPRASTPRCCPGFGQSCLLSASASSRSSQTLGLNATLPPPCSLAGAAIGPWRDNNPHNSCPYRTQFVCQRPTETAYDLPNRPHAARKLPCLFMYAFAPLLWPSCSLHLPAINFPVKLRLRFSALFFALKSFCLPFFCLSLWLRLCAAIRQFLVGSSCFAPLQSSRTMKPCLILSLVCCLP